MLFFLTTDVFCDIISKKFRKKEDAMATLKDIAALAGVNVSTVSKALRGSNDINEQTVMRIRGLAQQVGYNVPMPPKTSRTDTAGVMRKTVGVIFPELASKYYNDIQHVFCEKMRADGYRPVITLTDFDKSRELEAVNSFLQDGVSGIFLLTENSSHIRDIRRLVTRVHTPFMLVCTEDNIDFCDSIGINHTMGAVLAVNHLIELGHRRIAFIGEHNTALRMSSFISTMHEHGLSLPDEYIVCLDERFEECGYRGMRRLLSVSEPPTAVFAAYDNIAYGAMRAIREAGLRIPEDISVIGIDANPTSKFMWPALTSVDSPTGDIGELAAVLLHKRMDGEPTVSYQSVRLCPTLKVFESTAAPAAE